MDEEDEAHFNVGSPTLSQMLVRPELRHAAFRYPDVGASMDKRLCTPLTDHKKLPKTPASAPPSVINRSGSKSLGIRRRFQPVENYSSPCLRQKRPATQSRSRLSDGVKKFRCAIGQSPPQLNTTVMSVAKSEERGCKKAIPVLAETKSVVNTTAQLPSSALQATPTISGFRTAADKVVNISSKALKCAELLFSKIEKQLDETLIPTNRRNDESQENVNGTHQNAIGLNPEIGSRIQSCADASVLSDGCMPDTVCLEKTGLNSHVNADVETSMQVSGEEKFQEKRTVASVQGNSTSPILYNRRAVRKRLKRRKIKFPKTSKNPSLAVTQDEVTDANSSNKSTLMDLSFLDDGLDTELLAVGLEMELNKGSESAKEKRSNTVPDTSQTLSDVSQEIQPRKPTCNLKHGVEQCNCPEANSSSNGRPPSSRAVNIDCPNIQQSSSITLDPDKLDDNLPQGNKLLAKHLLSPPKNSHTASRKHREEANLLVDCKNKLKNTKNEPCNSFPLDPESCTSSLRPPDPYGRKRSKSMESNVAADEGISSDDELLLQIGAELDGEKTFVDTTLPAANAKGVATSVRFLTASKKHIAVSKAALNRAERLFSSLQNEMPTSQPSLPQSKWKVNESLVGDSSSTSICGQKCLPVENKIQNNSVDFQTASNKPLVISEAAIVRARAMFFTDNEMPEHMEEELTKSESSRHLSDEKAGNQSAMGGLTNMFKMGVLHRGRKRNEEFKAPTLVKRGVQTLSESQCELTDCHKVPTTHKKILGLKHFGDSQIIVSDESLVKAVELFEDLFS